MVKLFQSSSFVYFAAALLVIGHIIYYSVFRLNNSSLGRNTMEYSLFFWVFKDIVALLALYGVYEKTKNLLTIVPALLLLSIDVYYWNRGAPVPGSVDSLNYDKSEGASWGLFNGLALGVLVPYL